MAEVVISEFMDEAAIAEQLGGLEVLYDPALVDDPPRLQAALAGARALIVRNRTQVRGALLAAAGALRCVGRLGVGLDNIDVEACAARGIAVFPATGANTIAVAEYVLAALLLLLRGAYQEQAAMIAGAWPRNRLIGREAAGRTLGLIGFGGIAREVARRAAALGMRVSAHDPHLPAESPHWALAERHATLPALLRTSDVVSLHVPLTEETRNLLDSAALAGLKPGAILINTARGGILDEAALIAALREGRLAGAALDVFAEEPQSAALGARFAGVPNLILTPHIAGVTRDSNTRISHLIAEKVAAHLAGGAV